MPAANRTFKTAAYGHLAGLGKALASPARLELLELLAQAPRTVEVLAGEIQQSTANTSHHLQTLKRAQLVHSHRQGLHVVYSLAGEDVAALTALLQEIGGRHLAGLEKLKRDYFQARDQLEPIDAQTLLQRLEAEEVTLVDVRPEHEYAAGHLPQALSIPLADLDDRLDLLPEDTTIVAYCRGPFCTFSIEAVEKLRALGYQAVRAEVSVQAGLPQLEAPQ